MAIATFDAYKDEVQNQAVRFQVTKNNLTTVANALYSLYAAAPNAGTAPSTAAAPDNTHASAVFQNPRLSSFTAPLYLAQAELSNAVQSGCTQMLIDRLSHQGGLSGIVATAQTTNLPTAALSRYTSGDGVMAALEIYTAVGATAQTATCSYTNQAGTAGRTSKPVAFGATGNNAAGRFILLPLQDGDTGVRSVESVLLSGSTVTAGNFGVTLFKPIRQFSNAAGQNQGIQTPYYDAILGGGGNLPEIIDTACLGLIVSVNATGVGVICNEYRLIEG